MGCNDLPSNLPMLHTLTYFYQVRYCRTQIVLHSSYHQEKLKSFTINKTWTGNKVLNAMDKDTQRKLVTAFKDAWLSLMLKLVHYTSLLLVLCGLQQGKKTHKIITKVTKDLGSLMSSCQTSGRLRALTLHKHLQSLVKKTNIFSPSWKTNH